MGKKETVFDSLFSDVCWHCYGHLVKRFRTKTWSAGSKEKHYYIIIIATFNFLCDTNFDVTNLQQIIRNS